jgi:UDP-3-O-[3-hydroxymyristoyl] glucosamine N-acyltransferase LpxD
MLRALILKWIPISEEKVPIVFNLGMVNSTLKYTFCFAEDVFFYKKAKANTCISFCLLPLRLEKEIADADERFHFVKEPRELFFQIFIDYTKQQTSHLEKSRIANTAKVGENVSIAEVGVEIGANTIVESGCIIRSGVSIGSNCIVRAGTVLGSEGFEFKKIYGNLTQIPHNKEVVIEDNVTIGLNCVVDKGIYARETRIGSGTKIDANVHIAHAVIVGSNCMIASGVLVCGSSTIGNACWLGPRSVISNGLIIGDNVNVKIGSVVLNNILSNATVIGSPARTNLNNYLKLMYDEN